LPSIKLLCNGKRKLTLVLPASHRDLMGERVEKRINELASLTGRRPAIEIAKG
jgi:hypothetical protein